MTKERQIHANGFQNIAKVVFLQSPDTRINNGLEMQYNLQLRAQHDHMIQRKRHQV